MKKWGLTLAASMSVLALASCGAPGEPGASSESAEGDTAAGAGGSRLQTVLDRGELNCGVDGGIPGFSFLDEGAYSGMDVDICKAVASALFGDPEKVVYRNLDSTERFEKLGVDVIYGTGQFVDDKTFEVNGRQLKARAFLVATGSRPTVPPVEGLKEAGFLTNEEVFNVKNRPDALAVIGAGPIGCELGQSFSRLGSKVTLLASRDVIMPKEDPEAAAVVQAQL